jgi:methionyl-tRNA formyltransferase
MKISIVNNNGRLYNYHPANLPDERGSGCLTWKMLQKKFKKNFINIHKVEEDFDTGDIVSSKKIIFKKQDFLPRDYLKLIRAKEQSFLINFINKIQSNKKIVAKKQKGEDYYWPSLNADIDGKIDWSWNIEDIVLFIKSFSHPYNGAYSFINSNKIKIFDAKFIKKTKFHPFQNGLVFRENQREICIAKNYGHIVVKKKNLISQKIQKVYLGKKFI